MRVWVVGLVCCIAFALAVATVYVTARNRERARELDRWQRWCEIFARQNDSLRAQVERREWLLLTGQPDETVPETERLATEGVTE